MRGRGNDMVVKEFKVAGVEINWVKDSVNNTKVDVYADYVSLDADELDEVIDVLRAAYYEVKEAAGKP